MALPGHGTIINVCSARYLTQECRAPKGGADSDLARGRTDVLAGAFNGAVARADSALEAALEAVDERLLLGLHLNHTLMTRTRFCDRDGDSDDDGARKRRENSLHGLFLLWGD